MRIFYFEKVFGRDQEAV